MRSRQEFARELAKLNIGQIDQAVAFLWYYRNSQDYEERAPSDLANDLHDEGFSKPNVTRLSESLRKSKFTIRGKRPGTFQLDVRYIAELDEIYGKLIKSRTVDVSDNIIPIDWVKGKDVFWEKIVYQINGSYQFEFYDACAVLCRRFLESLIIKIYLSRGRGDEIKRDGKFIELELLINRITTDSTLSLGRNSLNTMKEIKQIGDTAAHDRSYLTLQIDIDPIKHNYRKLINELLQLAAYKSKV